MNPCNKLLEHLFRLLLFGIIILILLKFIIPRTSIYFRFQFLYPKFGMVLNEHDIVLITGESKKIYVKTINKRVYYESSDFKVVSVNQLGKLTALRPGLSYIKVRVSGKVLKCRVRVIGLNHSYLRLSVGKSKWLNVRGCMFYERYKSSDVNVVKVSRYGRVTAVSKGSAVITVTAFDRKMECKIVVR